MKKILLAVAMTVAAFSASAGKLSLDYDYARVNGGAYSAAHTAGVTLEQKLGFGNVKLGVGGVQSVTNTRENGTVYGIGYNFDISTPVGTLSPEAGVVHNTLAGGFNTWDVGAKLRTPLTKNVKLLTGVNHAETFSADFYKQRATSAQVGAEIGLTKTVALRAGYEFTRLHTVGRNADGVFAGLDFRF